MNHLVHSHHDERYHKTVRGVVTKLTKKGGVITSKSKLYKFKIEAAYNNLKKNMLVDMLLAENDFVTRVDGVH